MNQNKTPASGSVPSEAMIQKLLHTGKQVFPESMHAVLDFERRYGSWDIQLPDALQEPEFLYETKKPPDLEGGGG